MAIFAAVAMYIAVRIFSTDKVLTAKFSFKRTKKRKFKAKSSFTFNHFNLSLDKPGFIPSKNKILSISFCGYFSLTNWLNMG